uniref:Sidekick cell adhesion molecule 2 n=1 Tax=Cyclopterus lumpus TaxID=8103 RepID=A0A8C2ZPN3_CYCLU
VDDVAPYFKMEPPQTQVHLEGNRLVLTCMAEGSWPLEFKWIYNGSELTRFSLEYRYLIPSLDRSHAGHYRCIVRNRVGAIMQCSTEVQVAYMGAFVEGERSQTVSQGEGALMRAPRIHSFPRPQITWFRDGRKIPSSSRIAITLDNTLVILSTVAPDAGSYYAQAVNDKNGENKTSQPITLTVESKYTCTLLIQYITESPVIYVIYLAGGFDYHDFNLLRMQSCTSAFRSLWHLLIILLIRCLQFSAQIRMVRQSVGTRYHRASLNPTLRVARP